MSTFTMNQKYVPRLHQTQLHLYCT